MATGTQTATVETLTAEVRVLMVGSRQVTLSVYRQLDEFTVFDDDWCMFRPFGRVSTGLVKRIGALAYEATLELVGVDPESGVLARFTVLDGDEYEGTGDEGRRVIRTWRKLPLIVLAGLR